MGVDQMQLDELAIRPNGFRPNGNVPIGSTYMLDLIPLPQPAIINSSLLSSSFCIEYHNPHPPTLCGGNTEIWTCLLNLDVSSREDEFLDMPKSNKQTLSRSNSHADLLREYLDNF